MLNFPGLNVISPVCSVFLIFCSQSICPFRPAQILSIQKEGKNLQERVELTVVRCKSFVRLWSILWGCHWCLKFPVRKSVSSHIFCSIWLAKKALRGEQVCYRCYYRTFFKPGYISPLQNVVLIVVWTLSFEKMWLKQEITILIEIAVDGSRGFIQHPPEFSLLCNSESNRLDIFSFLADLSNACYLLL